MKSGPPKKDKNVVALHKGISPGQTVEEEAANTTQTTYRERPSTAPNWLSKEAKAEWKRLSQKLFDMGLLKKEDRGIFTAYCAAWGRMAAAEKALRKEKTDDPMINGLLSQTKNGNLIYNQLMTISRAAAEDVAKYSERMGLTPASRHKVASKDPPLAPATKTTKEAAVTERENFYS